MNPANVTSRNVRLASGLVLLAYVATHLLNHAVGLVSLRAAEAGREVFLALWRSLPGTAAFYGALLVHFALALAALFERRVLRMPLAELVRIALGFAIPFLLASHFVGTRLMHEVTGLDDTYARIVSLIWAGGGTLDQLALLLVSWLHGCLGIHFAFGHRAAYRRWQPALVAVATLLPVLAATGYLALARELETRPVPVQVVEPAAQAVLEGTTLWMTGLPLALLLLALAARALRNQRARRARGVVRITYPSATAVVPMGYSVLEASREAGIPHLSLCGGRARCSTCRVLVEATQQELPAPGPDEARTLERIRAGTGVRLACQLRPTGDLQVRPLLAPRSPLGGLEGLPEPMEREVIVMFADLRGWTGISERQLPHDLVYVLDRYFEAVGDAVREAGGIPNQFIGDSVMALFGVDQDAGTGARQALAAIEGIARHMATLNAQLQREFGGVLDYGIGMHLGAAAVGTVGYRETRTLSAVGDAVNTASRLQEFTKVLGARAVVSEAVFLRADHPKEGWEAHEVEVRGRTGRLKVYARVAKRLDD